MGRYRSPGGRLLHARFVARRGRRLPKRVANVKQPGDVVIAVAPLGQNWGYEVPQEQCCLRMRSSTTLAWTSCTVIPRITHDPSRCMRKAHSHGCGDLLNDYEGIAGYEAFRGDLVLMYFVTVDATSGGLAALDMVPLRMNRFRLTDASEDDVRHAHGVLDRTSHALGAGVARCRGAIDLSCFGRARGSIRPGMASNRLKSLRRQGARGELSLCAVGRYHDAHPCDRLAPFRSCPASRIIRQGYGAERLRRGMARALR